MLFIQIGIAALFAIPFWYCFFCRLCPYFDGRHHLEEIMYYENVRHSQLLTLLDKFRSVLITCIHEDEVTSFWNSWRCLKKKERETVCVFNSNYFNLLFSINCYYVMIIILRNTFFCFKTQRKCELFWDCTHGEKRKQNAINTFLLVLLYINVKVALTSQRIFDTECIFGDIGNI
jgi:hypothetical protein